MAAFAPPVRRGDFIYTSILYADAGNDNHHPRASTAELTSLLRPTPDKRSKARSPVATTPTKDPAWHWYAAQLIHYGLPVTKEKSRAKVRLLDALNQGKLEVPSWISKMEGEMRGEWEGENKKLKKGGGGVKDKAGKSSGAVKGKAGKSNETVKGKAGKGGKGEGGGGSSIQVPGGGINVNVNLSINSGLLALEQLDLKRVVGELQKGKRKRGKEETADEKPSPKKVTVPRGKASTSTAKGRCSTPQATSKPATKTPRIKKGDPPASSPYLAPPIKPESTPSSASPFTTKNTYSRPQTARKSAPMPRFKKGEPPASSPYSSPPTKLESKSSGHTPSHPRRGYIKQEQPSSQPTILLSGTYTIHTINSPASAYTHLDVYKDPTRVIWWVNIILTHDHNAERHQFFIKMDPGPSFETLGRAVTLGWRMRVVDTKEVKFGTGCTGGATFSMDGESMVVDVVLRNVPGMGDVHIRAFRLRGASQAGDLQEDWEDVRRVVYG